MTKARIPILVASGLFFLSIFYACVAVFFLPEYVIKEEARKFDEGVKKELSYLANQGDLIAQNEAVATAAATRDALGALSILNEERMRRNIGLMGLTDSEGYIISRTRTSTARGDNPLIGNPQGRAVRQSTSTIQSIELSGFDPRQVLFTTARWVYQGEQQVGVLFANYLADDAFSERFSKTYLQPSTRMAFYTTGEGIYGTNFVSEEEKRVVASLTPELIFTLFEQEDEIRVAIHNDTWFVVKKIPFTGLEGGSHTGALLFVPIKNQVLLLTLVFVSGLVFLLLSVWFHHHTRRERTLNATHLVIAGGTVFFIIVGSISFYVLEKQFVPLKSHQTIYNSVLLMSPASGVYDIAIPRKIQLLVETSGEHINALSANVKYDPLQVTVESVDIENSVCVHFITNTLNKKVAKLK